MAARQKFDQYGLETLEVIRKEFKIDAVPGYAEAIEEGKSPAPAFNWAVGVLMSAMSGAARIDAGWKRELRRFVEATRAYWNEARPVAGYDVLPMPKPVDRYYDDNAWMALALVEASELLAEPKFLRWAVETLTHVLSGEDEKLGGGIYWRESDKKSKNACSNGPSAAACLAVYEKTKEARLLDRAKALYDWTKRTLQDPSDHLVWDSIALDRKVDRTKWSYNTALMIRTAAELGRITGERAYAGDAETMATASEKRWHVNGRLADEGKFAHLLLESWLYAPSADRRSKAIQALTWLREHGTNSRGFYGARFDKAPEPDQRRFALIDQASAARAYLNSA